VHGSQREEALAARGRGANLIDGRRCPVYVRLEPIATQRVDVPTVDELIEVDVPPPGTDKSEKLVNADPHAGSNHGVEVPIAEDVRLLWVCDLHRVRVFGFDVDDAGRDREHRSPVRGRDVDAKVK
jgi:hypothetical protein